MASIPRQHGKRQPVYYSMRVAPGCDPSYCVSTALVADEIRLRPELQRMPENPRRLVGWKSIAAHFGRDRTTIIRWTRERNLPVHRTPGGKISSVFAYAHELDEWLKDGAGLAAATAPAGPAAAAASPARSTWRRPTAMVTGAIAVAVAIAAGISAAWQGDLPRDTSASSPQAATGIDGLNNMSLPGDPKVAALYLQARRDWARRRSDTIASAIVNFGKVISEDPGYAPAYSGLADAYILSREFGAIPDEIAFPRARAAALVSIRIAPRLADAHRALGFVEYWWDENAVAAGRSFRRAIELDPGNAQSHHWYGTALTDTGEYDNAMRELSRARGLNPESSAIESDWAYLLWALGRRDEAMATLQRLSAEDPDFAGPYDCLRFIRLTERNFPAYLDTMSRLAELRGEPLLVEQVRTEQIAFGKGGLAALRPLLLKHSIDTFDRGAADSMWPMSVASAVADRDALVRQLELAPRKTNRLSAPALDAMMRAWKHDASIIALLRGRRPTQLEPA